MYSVFAIMGINVLLVSPFPTHEDCAVWLKANRPSLIAFLESLPVQAPSASPLFYCAQRPPKAGTESK